MHRSPLSVLLFGLLAVVPSSPAAAPPPLPTEAQRASLREADAWFGRADALLGAKRNAEALEAVLMGLGFERRAHGEVRASRLGRLRWAAYRLEAAGRSREAGAAFEERLTAWGRIRGADDWRTGNARRGLEEYRERMRMPAAQRARLAEATRLQDEAAALFRAGKAKQALPIAKSVVALRRELQGEGHPAYAWSLSTLAQLTDAVGDHKAKPVPDQQRLADLLG